MATDEHHPLGQWDVVVDVLVNWIGWLVAIAFVVGCVPGWWWGGDLSGLPFTGESVAEAAAAHRGWPECRCFSLRAGRS
ncbi:hypothetical protein OG462_42485 [Streptomyces sp. NBC_01077]|uniref:hypothetical protein n=1 Tax=Streptomyces sp. NBC_01077 TaxID=2903746 RepID=UPI00386C2C95|nr:hypothetical protein OG462_02535 [Streptomyces sp. NBC_01077]WSV43511.1 hypothetical protein OG462_42485 [Streptomyces sp. NBC_01077]